MTSKNEISKLCRLCLVKEQVNVPIFEEEGDLHPICLKINACLFLKLQVAKEDKLPKKICDGCMYKLDLLYQFTNTCVKAEKQLTEWLKQCESNGEIANVIVEPNAHEIIQNEAEEALLANYELALQQGVFDDNDNTNNKNNETDQINNITSRKRKLSTQEQNIEQDKEEGSPKAKNSKIDDNENHSIAVEQEKVENESFVQQDIAATSTIAETTIQTEDEEAAGPSGIGEKTTKENGDGDGNDEETTAVEATKKMAKGKNRKRIVLKLKKSTGNDYQKEKEDNVSTTAEDSSIEDEETRRRKQRYDKELKLLGILHPNEEVSVERRIKTRRMTNTDGPTETTCVDEKALKREMVLAKRRAEYYEKKRKLEEKRLRSKQRYEERKREKMKSKKGVNGHDEQEKLRNRDQDQDPAVVEKAIDSNVNLNKEETSTELQIQMQTTVQSVAATAAGTASQSFEKEVTNKSKEAESEELFKKYEWRYGLKQGFVFLGEPKRVFQNPQRFILHKTFVKNSTNLLDKTLVSEANIIKNAGRPRFTCAICKAKFHAEHELNVHLVAGHEDFLEENPMQQYSCAVCCIKVPPNLYISHLEEHKCVCLVCMFVASEESTLDEHIKKEHANLAFSRDLNFEKPPATPQEDASTTTTNPRNKNKNEQQTSKKNTKQQDKNSRKRSTSSDKKNKNKDKDKEASKRLPSPVDAEQNKKTDKSEDRNKVNDGEKEKTKDEALNNDNKNKDRKSLTIFRCKICKQQFRTEELAKEHYISNHLNIKTLNVNSNAKNAAKSSEKEAGTKNAQEKVPTIHQCGVCFQKFASFEEGMLHCQTMHPNDKNNEQNTEVPELKSEGEEENNHTSDRKVCKDCGATFISEDALKRHQKKHEMEKETQQQNVQQQSKSGQRQEEQQIQQNPQINVQQHQKNVQQIQANQQKQSLNAQVQQQQVMNAKVQQPQPLNAQVQPQQVMNVQLQQQQQQQAVINHQAVNVNLQHSQVPNMLYFTVPTVPGGNFQLLPNSTVSQIPFATTVVPSPPTTSVQQVSRPQQSLLIQQQQHQQQNHLVQQQSLLVQQQQRQQNSPVQQQSLLVQQQQNPLVQQQQQHQQVIPGQGMQQVRPIYVQRSTVQHQQQPNPNSNNSAGIQKHTIQGVPSSTILQGGGIPLVQQQIQHRQQDTVVRRRIQPSQQKKTLNIPIKLIQQSLQQINLPRQIQSATTSTVTSTTTAAINSSATTTAQSQSTPTNNNNKNNTMVMQRFLLNHNKNLNVQNAKSGQKVNPPPLITMPTIVNAFSLANKEVANTEKKPVGYLTITSRDGVPKNILLNTTNVSSVVTSGAQAVPSVSATSSKNTSLSSTSSSHNNNTDINTNNVIVNSNSLLNSLLRNPKSKDDESTKKSKSSSDVSLECIEIFDDNEVEKETTKNTSPILSPASSASSSTTAASSSSTNVRQSPPQRIFLKPLRDLMETPKKPNQAGEENPPLQLKISNNFVKILNTNQPAVNPTKKNLRCAYCKYVFASHERFTKHRNLFGCFVCHYHTCNFSLLKAHAKKDHADMHVCLMCEVAFGNAESLNQHLEEKHKCQPCGINDGCRHSIQQILKLKKIDNPQKRTY